MLSPAGFGGIGSTSSRDLALLLGRSKVRGALAGLFCSLVVGVFGVTPINAADRLEVQLDEMLIPIPIDELGEWVSSKGRNYSELTAWINLLSEEGRAVLLKLLQAPLLKDQSMARRILQSWAGRQLLDEVSDLIRVDEDRSGASVLKTLESLLENQSQVTTLDLLQELPAESIRLDLDAILLLARRWRYQIQSQQKLLLALDRLSSIREIPNAELRTEGGSQVKPEKFPLKVDHRSKPLSLDVWRSRRGVPNRQSWVLLMPGLGGSQDHFHWLARSLSRKGWSVVVLEHPGSDLGAVQELLEGSRPLPGAEVLPERLADLKSVLLANEQGFFPFSEKELILMGHSLGALTALLAAGAYPDPGLTGRCKKALDDLSLTNLSQFLQCQLVDVDLLTQPDIPNLKAIVGINSFGSLLWPIDGESSVSVPILLVGGTYDLITPALSEQLGLFMSLAENVSSRTLLVEGASHFSPIRVVEKDGEGKGYDLFKLGEELVGVQPLIVQLLLAAEISTFLDEVENKKDLGPSLHKQIGGLRLHRLNRSTVKNLLSIQ